MRSGRLAPAPSLAGSLALAGALAVATPALALPSVTFTDGAGNPIERISLASSAPSAAPDDPDGFRVTVSGAAAEVPAAITIASHGAPDAGALTSSIEILADVPLERVPCSTGASASLTCARTPQLRAVFDDIDRRHPLSSRRSILAELGGAISASVGASSASARVDGPAGRQRARLRVHVLRMTPGGAPAIGRDGADAVRLVRDEVAQANGIWGACGIGFGAPSALKIDIVDPPPAWLLSVGCGGALNASGGELRFAVDGRDVVVPIKAGVSPRGAARVVAATLQRRGLAATVSDNGLSTAGARAASDVLVRRRDGKPATITPPLSGRVSSDATLEACIGRVALDDGLQHFGDADAVAGTIEERTLVKAYEDGDPSTLDVFVIPSFGGDARIGESFIFADAGAIKNTVIVDRAGFRAHRASFTLAHEIGHVLLDQPGHPDDFGVDTPTRLMDADAVNPTAFGPRRLERHECTRALRQSGEKSPSALLAPWPLAPIP